MAIEEFKYFMEGGLVLKAPIDVMKPGNLLRGSNVEPKINGGYKRIDGYAKYISTEITGAGPILGVTYYRGKTVAARRFTDGTVSVWEWDGSTWTAIATGLTAGGRFEFAVGLFESYSENQATGVDALSLAPAYGASDNSILYWVDGVNQAYRYTGSGSATAIDTGNSPDTPSHLLIYKNRLYLSFGQSLQYSPVGPDLTVQHDKKPGDFYGFAGSGAGELLMPDVITDLEILTGGGIAVFCRNAIKILSGDPSTEGFNSKDFSDYAGKVGAIEWSVQSLGSRIKYLDDRGVTDLGTTERYGNFVDATISYQVEDVIKNYKDSVSASCVVRDKSQYRIFFDDGSGEGRGLLFAFTGDQLIGITDFVYPHVVQCCESVEDSNGDELILFGSDDGYIRQLDEGNNFDGSAIVSWLRTAYTNVGVENQVKRFYYAVFRMKKTTGSTLQCKPDAVYSDRIPISHAYNLIPVNGTGDILGTGTLPFLLSSDHIMEGRIPINSHGDFLSLLFYSSDTDVPPWELDTCLVSYSRRRKRRGG